MQLGNNPNSRLRPGSKRQQAPRRATTPPRAARPKFEAHLDSRIDRHRPSTPRGQASRPEIKSSAAGLANLRGISAPIRGLTSQPVPRERGSQRALLAGRYRRSGRTGWHPADAALPIEGAGPHHKPAPFFPSRNSADLAHKGGHRSIALKLQRSILAPKLEPELGAPHSPLSRLPLPPPEEAFGAVCVEHFPCLLAGPAFLPLPVPYFSGSWLTPWPVRRGQPTRGSKNRPGRPPWTEGPRELSRIEAFSASKLTPDSPRGLCVLGLSRTGFAPSAWLLKIHRPPLGLGMLWMS